MYSSDIPYSVQLFVPPIRFSLQFLLTLVLNVSVFIFQTLLTYVRLVSSGTRFISQKYVGYLNTSFVRLHTTTHWILRHVLNSPAQHNTGSVVLTRSLMQAGGPAARCSQPGGCC
jgi:hypothetical protein